ncbi:MAG: HAD hydrolase-like protein, partial [Lachnospiraceae bacterium]|nr:HAD hydrolase-like protein [Lachnospiraceae bacterium]
MEAIIFDVDGTLWDSTEEVAVSWNRAIREQTDLNRVLTGSELKKEFGKPLEEIADDLFPTLSRKEKEELAVHLYQYENEWVESAPCILYDKMPETIRALSKRYRLFIVSNCQSGYIEAFLKNTGLGDCITDFTCPGDTGKLKGDNIKIIMERNGIREAVYV